MISTISPVNICHCIWLHFFLVIRAFKIELSCAVICLFTQSCLTLCDSMDSSLPGSSVLGNSPGKNTGVVCHALIWRIFPSQGLNPSLLHSRWILLPSELPGKPYLLPWQLSNMQYCIIDYSQHAVHYILKTYFLAVSLSFDPLHPFCLLPTPTTDSP